MRKLVNLYICDLCGTTQEPNGPEALSEVPHGWMAVGEDEAHLCPKCALSVYLALRREAAQPAKEGCEGFQGATAKPLGSFLDEDGDHA